VSGKQVSGAGSTYPVPAIAIVDVVARSNSNTRFIDITSSLNALPIAPNAVALRRGPLLAVAWSAGLN